MTIEEPGSVTSSPLDPGDPHGRGVPARPDSATERRLWFSLLAPPLAWSISEVVGVTVAGRRCARAAEMSQVHGSLETWQWIVLIGLPVLAAAVAIISLISALRVFRQWTGPVSIAHAEGWNRVEFMAIAGVIVSGALLLNIIYFAVMPLLLNPCLRAT